jgi:hypothetical protein
VHLQVDASGRALVTFRVGGSSRSAIARGAINAVAPARARDQRRFRVRFSGPHRRFRDACQPYDGPPLPWLVTACRAPDGSYWAVQRWQRLLRLGDGAGPSGWASEVRLSHWSGELARLDIKVDWAYRRYDHLFGRLTYRGLPVHGFRTTAKGAPLDRFGRNIYVDSLGSPLGSGWRRVAGLLTHRGTGAFCFGFFPTPGRPSPMGARYRATVIGPGVTPDIAWEGAAPGPYDRALDTLANEQIRALGSRVCRPN